MTRLLKSLLFLLVITLILFASTAHATPPIRITRDMGGIIADYVARGETWSRQHRRIIVSGPCNSACTVYLFTALDLDLCVTKTGSFGFHMEWYPIDGDAAALRPHIGKVWAARSRRAWATKMLPNYPPQIQAWLRRQVIPNPSVDGDTASAVVLRGREAQRLVKPC